MGTCSYILLQKQFFCHIFMFHQLQFIRYLFDFIYKITEITNKQTLHSKKKKKPNTTYFDW